MHEVRLKFLWCHLVGLRFILKFLPQYGYISEDEFTKSPEIMAGNIFPFISSSKGSNSSVIYPILSCGIPFLFLQFIQDLEMFPSILTPYAILLGPRLWSTFISLLCDILVFKLAMINGCNSNEAHVATVLFSSSYVVWVYFTRTFTVGLETILYAALLYVVIENSDYNQPNLNQTKGNQLLASKLKAAFLISGIVSFGMHMSPTFIHLGIFPLSYWIYEPCSVSHSNIASNVKLWLCNLLLILLSSIPISTVLYLTNELYINGGMLNMPIIPNLLLFPLHFKGSFYLDSFCGIKNKIFNIFSQVLNYFGPLVFQFNSCVMHGYFRLHEILCMSIVCIVMNTVLFTSAAMSLMIPMIIPMVIIVAKHANMSKFFIAFWSVFNFVCFMLFGVLNQPGVLQSLDFLGAITGYLAEMNSGDHKVNLTAVYYQTPLPPAYLTAWVNGKDQNAVNLDIIHIQSSTVDELYNLLDSLLTTEQGSSIMLVTPAVLICSVLNSLHVLYNVELFYQFYPHFRSNMHLGTLMSDIQMCDSHGSQNLFELYMENFSLDIYKVSRPRILPQNTNIEVSRVLLTSYALAQ